MENHTIQPNSAHGFDANHPCGSSAPEPPTHPTQLLALRSPPPPPPPPPPPRAPSKVLLCTMDVEPSLLTVSSVRDWSELPLDALSTIFIKLGTIEILMGAGLVCRSWLAAAKLPELWRFVDMTGHKILWLNFRDPETLCAMAKVAIDRSDRQMELFRAELFVTSELLDYIESRANSLKSIRLTSCYYLWTSKLERFASNCPLLEEIEFSYQKMLPEVIRHLGSVHPKLKRLRISLPSMFLDGVQSEYDESWDKNKEAFAIAESLHELQFLQMAGRCLSNEGVYAIMEGCPHLECLDISKCCDVDVDDELRAHCANIKCVLLPKRYRSYLHLLDVHVN